eukprot:TRINITY_DN630_c3_g1_i1.p1 TRINITY_DN630_c3_g1~~TRINITY_DN630_c3_g1_i1.p1  ORF type:complete len:1337 (+),score=314.68 TRINITY_DN630_c3_g1_i1:750-4760(+)
MVLPAAYGWRPSLDDNDSDSDDGSMPAPPPARHGPSAVPNSPIHPSMLKGIQVVLPGLPTPPSGEGFSAEGPSLLPIDSFRLTPAGGGVAAPIMAPGRGNQQNMGGGLSLDPATYQAGSVTPGGTGAGAVMPRGGGAGPLTPRGGGAASLLPSLHEMASFKEREEMSTRATEAGRHSVRAEPPLQTAGDAIIMGEVRMDERDSESNDGEGYADEFERNDSLDGGGEGGGRGSTRGGGSLRRKSSTIMRTPFRKIGEMVKGSKAKAKGKGDRGGNSTPLGGSGELAESAASPDRSYKVTPTASTTGTPVQSPPALTPAHSGIDEPVPGHGRVAPDEQPPPGVELSAWSILQQQKQKQQIFEILQAQQVQQQQFRQQQQQNKEAEASRQTGLPGNGTIGSQQQPSWKVISGADSRLLASTPEVPSVQSPTPNGASSVAFADRVLQQQQQQQQQQLLQKLQQQQSFQQKPAGIALPPALFPAPNSFPGSAASSPAPHGANLPSGLSNSSGRPGGSGLARMSSVKGSQASAMLKKDFEDLENELEQDEENERQHPYVRRLLQVYAVVLSWLTFLRDEWLDPSYALVPSSEIYKTWTIIFVMALFIAFAIDPLYFFVISVDKTFYCSSVDWKRVGGLTVLRSVTDTCYLLHIMLQFRLAYKKSSNPSSPFPWFQKRGIEGSNSSSYNHVQERGLVSRAVETASHLLMDGFTFLYNSFMKLILPPLDPNAPPPSDSSTGSVLQNRESAPATAPSQTSSSANAEKVEGRRRAPIPVAESRGCKNLDPVYVTDLGQIYENYMNGWFVADVLAVIPVPQLMVFFSPLIGVGDSTVVTSMFRMTVLLQYIPRFMRCYPLIMGNQETGMVFESAWSSFILNLVMYIMASHVVGAIWYFGAVQRFHECVVRTCRDEAETLGCQLSFLSCGSGVQRSMPDWNARMAWANETATAANCAWNFNHEPDYYNYGVFNLAVPLLLKGRFINKYFYSLQWGFTAISTLGGGQPSSENLGEVFFMFCITASGLFLFAVLIGNIQNFLQSLTRRTFEYQMKRRDMDIWMSRRNLPLPLIMRVKELERLMWAANQGVDEAEMLDSLTEDLQREVRRHLTLDLIKKSQLFSAMDEVVLEAIITRLRQQIYISETVVIREGFPVTRMFFLLKGKMVITTTLIGRAGSKESHLELRQGDFFGEELLIAYLEKTDEKVKAKQHRRELRRAASSLVLRQALPEMDADVLPKSERTIVCQGPVEGFTLEAEDLEFVCKQFSTLLRSPAVQSAMNQCSHHRRTHAAITIQLWYRTHLRQRLGISLANFYLAYQQGNMGNFMNARIARHRQGRTPIKGGVVMSRK